MPDTLPDVINYHSTFGELSSDGYNCTLMHIASPHDI
jgi:hypothetical protein